jgi:hypothetical protein
MERFTLYENIRSFRERLKIEDDPGRKGILMGLPIGEGAKHTSLKRRPPKNAFGLPQPGADFAHPVSSP